MEPIKLTKILILILYLTGFSTQSQSQEWFPLGAVWTYDFQTISGSEIFQASVAVIDQFEEDGITYSTLDLISDNSAAFSQCQALELPITAFVKNDSVFYSSEQDINFRLALLANASVGESWNIITEFDFGIFSNLVEIVESEQISLQGVNVEKWICAISTDDNAPLVIVSPTEIIAYIGSLKSLIFPLGILPVCDAITSVSLRCYNDNILSYIAPGFENCILSATSNLESIGISIYPVPTFDEIRFQLSDRKLKRASIIDLQGRILLDLQLQSGEAVMNVREIPAGIYLLKITDSNEEVFVQKIIVQ